MNTNSRLFFYELGKIYIIDNFYEIIQIVEEKNIRQTLNLKNLQRGGISRLRLNNCKTCY